MTSGKIRCANLDGTNIETLASLRSVPLGIAVDTIGRKLYWTNTAGKIKRASLNGKNIQGFVIGLGEPTGLALGIQDQRHQTICLLHLQQLVPAPDEHCLAFPTIRIPSIQRRGYRINSQNLRM